MAETLALAKEYGWTAVVCLGLLGIIKILFARLLEVEDRRVAGAERTATLAAAMAEATRMLAENVDRLENELRQIREDIRRGQRR